MQCDILKLLVASKKTYLGLCYNIFVVLLKNCFTWKKTVLIKVPLLQTDTIVCLKCF